MSYLHNHEKSGSGCKGILSSPKGYILTKRINYKLHDSRELYPFLFTAIPPEPRTKPGSLGA